MIWKTPCLGLREGAFAQGLGEVVEDKTNPSVAKNRRRQEELRKAWAKKPSGNHSLSGDGDAQSTMKCATCSTRWLYAYGQLWQAAVQNLPLDRHRFSVPFLRSVSRFLDARPRFVMARVSVETERFSWMQKVVALPPVAYSMGRPSLYARTGSATTSA